VGEPIKLTDSKQDNRGPPKKNVALSKQKADAVSTETQPQSRRQSEHEEQVTDGRIGKPNRNNRGAKGHTERPRQKKSFDK
jgi:hypothetical protein